MTRSIQKRRNGRETKTRLLDECIRLIAEQGLSGFTLDELAQRVGVAKTSILWHFGSKEDLVLEAVTVLFDDFEARLKASGLMALSAEELLPELLKRVSDWFEEAPQINAIFFQLLFQKGVHPDITLRLKEMYAGFRQRLKDALYNASLDEEENECLAIAVLALIDGVFVQFYLDPDAVSMKKTFSVLTGLHGRAF